MFPAVIWRVVTTSERFISEQEVAVRLLHSTIVFSLLAFAFVFPTVANAAGETADADVSISPRGPTFFSNIFSAANWRVDTAIIPPVLAPTITPMKVADLGLPNSDLLRFTPKASMPVCQDDQLGPPPTTNSIPVPDMIDRCPNSLIGNGRAVFGLSQSTAELATRDGEVLLFNGGRVAGLPKLKVYAYSYDTGVGIYTSAILRPDGQLRFEIPRLTADSSVRTLNLAIPGQRTVIEKPLFALTVVLPAGQDPTYAQARCVGNAGFPWTADFVLGSRDAGGNPIGDPEFTVSDSGTDPCTGVFGAARIGAVGVTGPLRVKRYRRAAYRVSVKNAGNITATGVRLNVFGRGIRSSALIGNIRAGATRSVYTRIRPRIFGRIRTTFRVTSTNAGSRSVVKYIRVVR
ncbi:MAG: hypothetical protein WEB05_03060 [Solirubrobacterales bacterium]